MKHLFTFLLLSALIFSCKSKTENPYTKPLDSLSIVLKQTDSVYQTIDWSKVIEIEKNINSDILKIDSLPKKVVKKNQEIIDTYKAIKLFGKIDTTEVLANGFDQSQHKKFLRKQIDYSISQLTNLKLDVETKSLKEDKIKEYIATEREAIIELHKFTVLKSVVNSNSISQFDKLKPQIDEMLNAKK